jgi:hypothetical protein
VIAVPLVVAGLFAAAQSDLQGLDGHEILFAELPCNVGRGDDGAGRAVAFSRVCRLMSFQVRGGGWRGSLGSNHSGYPFQSSEIRARGDAGKPR